MSAAARATSASTQVAAAAGVPVGTVTAVLRRPELASELTRERVLGAMEDLGFAPDDLLPPRPEPAVGLIVIDGSNPFYTGLACGVQDVARARGDVLLVGTTGGEVGWERRYLDIFERQHVRGLLLAPTHHDLPDLAGYESRGIPVVYVDRCLPEPGPAAVYVDATAGARLAAEHLVALGHRRVWFAGGPMSLQSVRDRLEGCREVLADAGGSVHYLPTEMVTVAHGRDLAEHLDIEHLDERDGGGPTAIFACNDLLALGLLEGLTSRGVRVPQDISLIGYDDIDVGAMASVPLTSVHQPAYDIGRKGAELLYARLDGMHDPAADPRVGLDQVRFDASLVVRRSTGAPRRT